MYEVTVLCGELLWRTPQANRYWTQRKRSSRSQGVHPEVHCDFAACNGLPWTQVVISFIRKKFT